MVTRNAGSVRRITRLFALSLTALFLLQTATGCGTPPSNTQASSPTAHASSVQSSASPTPSSVLTPIPTSTPKSTPLPATALHGPTNFLLDQSLNFSSATGTATDNSGSTTQLDAATIEQGVTVEFKHLLFVVSKDDVVKVYSPGATSATSTEVDQRPDGSTAIAYTQVEGTVTVQFSSAIYNDQIIVSYEQTYSAEASANDPLASEGSDVTVNFTTHVHWIDAKEIPTAPTNGQFKVSQKSVDLSWSAGQNVAGYDIYRLIPNIDQTFQLISHVTGTSYNDTSVDGTDNANSTNGVAYAIFAVGPTGVENPSNVIISITSGK